MSCGNALILQSGGPTAVINQTLAGIITASKDYPEKITKILGAVHGLHGLLFENFYDLSAGQTAWSAIAQTPGSALGSARLKPKSSDLSRIFEVFLAHNIKYLFYNGGNDSAEAAQLIRSEANKRHFDLQILHVPKTIDNDLCVTDHSPGYGSVAQVVSQCLLGDDLDNKSFYNGIKINVVMGRHAGWIAAATALAKFGFRNKEDSASCGPHLIYFPEIKFERAKFLRDVQEVYNKIGRATIVVAEGVADNIDRDKFSGEKDEFGNAQFSGSGELGDYLSHLVKENIKVDGTLGKLRCRADTLGYLQRSLAGIASSVDQQEAFLVGTEAVRYMMAGESDKMVTLVREEGDYRCTTGLCDLSMVAQQTKQLPRSMINEQGNGVSDAFIRYALPLIDSIPEVQALNIPVLTQKLPPYSRESL